ncbi:FG-GAP-like repeat-containing protein [Singulisphaera sp. PoT]|uniref:FG-GAP-like repeat-containing protein n=1 Tax=Singulisphaera sp. PoT TaxID=3411797 RepID=UPI003BF5895B
MVHRHWLIFGLGLAVLTLAGGGYRHYTMKALRAELDRARADYEKGYPGLARQRLAELARSWPSNGEVLFQLGICEDATGRRENAVAAWSKVPRSSSFFARAVALRAEAYLDAGKYNEAEPILEEAYRETDLDLGEIRRVLLRLYRYEGRTADVRKLVRESWPSSPDPIAVLKELWLIDNTPVPAEALATVLAKADPEDDRVWLGRANLATLTGRFDEAKQQLEACRKSRPDDAAVWRSELDYARAAGDVDAARLALPHLPAEVLSKSEVLAFRAWMAGRLGKPEQERAALLALLEHEPGNASAFDRLATASWDAGKADEAKQFRARKQVVDDAKNQYRALVLNEPKPAERAEDFAKLAATLGLRFDARAWSHLNADLAAKTRLLDEWRAEESVAARSETLAGEFADLLPAQGQSSAKVANRAQAQPHFTDDAQAVGLQFNFDNGQTPLRQLPETMSGGVAVLDYDGDGWYDVYVVQGGPLAPESTEGREGDRLFRNQGDGTFRDVTASAHLTTPIHEYTMGVTAGDYDGDGDPDLFVSRLRSYLLYRNKGDGTFEDVTEAAGLAGLRDYPSSAAFADLDNDGDLDLYVCQYMLYDPTNPRLCRNEKGEYYYCDPSQVDPAPDHVFRNDEGRFVDVTAEAGFVDPGGRGLGVVVADLDDDDKVDLFVANDGSANYLFHNLGGFKFEETGHLWGVAGNAGGGYQAGMGVACVDLDGDGRPELLVTNFYGEGTTLYQNLGQGAFHDASAASGLGAATRYLLGFGIAPIDFDADGKPDLMIANGNVHDQRPKFPYAMPATLYANAGGGRLTDVTARAGEPFQPLRVGRGLATGDLDNDGKLDAVLVGQFEPLAYFHNRTPGGHFVTFLLEGTRSNRDGIGAKVTLTTRSGRQVAHRYGGGSYQSASDPRLHFGLGADEVVEQVEIRWPSGRIDRYSKLAADTGYRLREADPNPAKLAGFARREK